MTPNEAVTPLIKLEIKEKITRRRVSQGLSPVPNVDDDSPKTYEVRLFQPTLQK